MKHKKVICLLSLMLLVFFGVQAWAQTARIVVEAMSPERLIKKKMTTNISSGLTTVPKGTYVYLSAQAASGSTVQSVSWSVVTKPVGSTAVFDSVNKPFTTIRLDSVGQYVLKASITSSAGTKDTTVTVTAANFVGVGSIGGKTPSLYKGQCAACHKGQLAILDDKVTPWSTSPHATMAQRGMDGKIAPYYSAACLRCHTTGYDTNADNGNFAHLTKVTGWTFPSPLKVGNFDTLVARYPDLAQVATIGCESCHGPGSLHYGDGKKIDATMEAGVCAQCHDEPWRHNRVVQWEASGHAEAVWSNSFRQAAASQNNNLQNCVRCHDGRGFVNFTRGKTTNTTAGIYEQVNHTKITCQTCHDPHTAGLRSAPIASDTLSTGFNYSGLSLGSGKLCVNCHKYRRAEYAVVGTNMTSTWGPHYAGAADVFLGQNGHTFGVPVASSIAHRLIENSCVGCHMSATPDTGSVARDKIGMHTWNMSYTTPTGVTVDNVSGCVKCHTGITKFDDIKSSLDYDGNGTAEAFMTEVKGMLKKLAKALPPYGSETIDRTLIATSPDSVRLKKAFWNYLYLNYGSGMGVHNPKYVVGLLQRTFLTVTGVELVNNEIPETFTMTQNYPNPFNPTTDIQFTIPRDSKVQILIYDIRGRKVKTLVDNIVPPGTYKATWDGRDDNGLQVASGVYLYRIVAENTSGVNGQNYVLTKKMILLK